VVRDGGLGHAAAGLQVVGADLTPLAQLPENGQTRLIAEHREEPGRLVEPGIERVGVSTFGWAAPSA